MKRTAFKRKAPTKRVKRASPTKGYKCPPWFMEIERGSHGYSPAQQRAWKVTTDTYRKADFERSPYCPGCGGRLENWYNGDLGHWHRWALCNGWMKFCRKNMLLICKGCNKTDSAIIQRKMGMELQRRYGEDVLDWIERENNKPEYRGQKIEDWMYVEYVANLRPDLVH